MRARGYARRDEPYERYVSRISRQDHDQTPRNNVDRIIYMCSVLWLVWEHGEARGSTVQDRDNEFGQRYRSDHNGQAQSFQETSQVEHDRPAANPAAESASSSAVVRASAVKLDVASDDAVPATSSADAAGATDGDAPEPPPTAPT